MNRQKIKEMLDERIGQKDAHKLEEYEWIVGLMEMVAYEVECDLGAKNMLLETELNALKETAESIAEQRDRLQNNLIDKEEVNAELRQTIIAKQQREIRLEDILAPHQELTQWIEEEMTCEPNSNKFEVSHDFLEALFYKAVQINH